MIGKNQTWELVERTQNRKVIGFKWVYKTKLKFDGSVNKYKARRIVKGYAQIWGVDYSETFAPVARLDTIRLLLAIVAERNWKIYQLDVKSVFLNGVLEEEIYVEQLEGFEVKGAEGRVYKLRKGLYGLKQAPSAWYNKIDTYLQNLKFEKSLSESTLYVKKEMDSIVILSLYVDDLLVTGDNKIQVEKLMGDLHKVFEMTDLGEMSYFLGMEVQQRKNEVFICQKKYLKEIMKKFKIEECNSASTPMNLKEKLKKDDGSEKVISEL
ncbi:hypothetical protein CRG98_030822 [Punica granatum]|uniref:Reverse transcriptase Ty1/copia-type domain-containing protein n=1 Tax=Punica granatum TaxID=22663 RepID=A0A2I0IYN5_PUNGR|nr:hypothetical protein CRG98_030822 [Punica granatum]